MRRLPHDIDIHTHAGAPRPGAVLCIDPTEVPVAPVGRGLLSAGIHPWNADRADEDAFDALARLLSDARTVALGEAGLDRLRGPSMERQMEVFERQARMAENLDLPLVIHCVRAFDLLLGVRKRLAPSNQWIVHGFRGKAAQARQLLDAGIDLSFGERFNKEAYDITPADRRYNETDML